MGCSKATHTCAYTGSTHRCDTNIPFDVGVQVATDDKVLRIMLDDRMQELAL